MGFVMSVSQSKGGSTKTTTAVNLCGALIEKGYKAVVADMDKDKPDAVNWARQAQGLEFVIELFDEKPMDKLDQLKQQFDVVILDTPPNYMPAAFKAIILSDFVLLPCSPSFLDQNNLTDAVSIPKMAKKPFRILGTKTQKRQRLSELLIKELDQSELAFKTVITSKTAMLESQFKGQWVGEYKPGCDNHREFLNLADELLNLVELQPLLHDVLQENAMTDLPVQTSNEKVTTFGTKIIGSSNDSLICHDSIEEEQGIIWDNGPSKHPNARS